MGDIGKGKNPPEFSLSSRASFFPSFFFFSLSFFHQCCCCSDRTMATTVITMTQYPA